MRSKVMYLNGDALTLGENNALPELTAKKVTETVTLAPGACAFVLV